MPAIGVGLSPAKPGTTPDKVANQWHRDLTDLSGNKLVALTKAIIENGETGTVLKKEIETLVKDGVERKYLPEKMLERLNSGKAG